MGPLMNLLSGIMILLAIGFTIFVNYPEPPLSPLLYQWQTNGGHYLQFRGYQVFYKDETQPTAANDVVVLCLHGFPTSSFDWYKTWPDLKRNVRRLIAPDFLGFGFSDKPRFHKYSIAEQSDLIVELIAHLNIKSVHILAHDYGDTVTQELMARHLENKLNFNIESVCLLNGGIFPTLHKARISQKILRMPIVGTVISKLLNYYTFKLALSEVFGPNTQPSMAEYHDLWKLCRQQDGYRVFGDLLSYIDERLEHEDRWVGALRSQRLKLHFIYGPNDPVNPVPFAQTYMKIIPDASIDILENDISHYPQLESPKQMIGSYLNWLKRHSFIQQLVFNT